MTAKKKIGLQVCRNKDRHHRVIKLAAIFFFFLYFEKLNLPINIIIGLAAMLSDGFYSVCNNIIIPRVGYLWRKNPLRQRDNDENDKNHL